ncbi:hypothetical protein Tco_1351900 [Tanacetum coccineum]
METIHVTFDELTSMASEQFGSGPGLQVMTPATSSSGLVPNIIPQQPCNPPKRDDWDTLFQPLFDEYFNPPTIVVSTVPVAAAPRAVEIADSLVSTSIDQDAPSSSIPSTQDQEHSLIISQGITHDVTSSNQALYGLKHAPRTCNFMDDDLDEMRLKLEYGLLSMGQESSIRELEEDSSMMEAICGYDKSKVNKYGPRDSSLKPTTGCDKESDNSKENTDDSLKQQQKTDSKTSSVKFHNLRCPNVHKHMVPRAVLMKNGLKTVNTARPVNNVRSVNTDRPFSTAGSFNTVRPSYTAHPKSTVHCARPRTHFQNQEQSTVHRPFYKRTALTKRSYNQNVNIGRQNVNTVREKGFNAVKPSACWVWKPIKPNGASLVFNKYNYIDARGRSKSVMAWVPKEN